MAETGTTGPRGTTGAAAAGAAPDALPKGFRGAELGWPELHRHSAPAAPAPPAGRLLGASRHTPVQDSLRYAGRLGPIFRRKAFNREFVFVWGAELAADMADEQRFAKHVGLGLANLRPVVGDALFTAYNHEPNWQLAHDVLAPGFSREAMAAYHPMMLDVAERLTGHWDRELAAGRAVDVPGDMTKLTLETIARTGFGHDFGSFERDRPHPFVTAMVGTLTYAQRLNTVAAPPRCCGGPRAATGPTSPTSTARSTTWYGPAGRGRAAGTATCSTGCSTPPTRETGERLSDRERAPTGHHLPGRRATRRRPARSPSPCTTSPGTPSIAARARAEVDRVWGDTAVPGYDQVAKLRYVRRVLDEALRLWPTAPALRPRGPRRTRCWAGSIRCGGVRWALVLTGMLHRDPAVWGSGRRAVRPGPLRRPGRPRPGPAHLQAVRDRRAGVHRTPVRAARGDAGPRPAAAPL